jgi:hypothetical protein
MVCIHDLAGHLHSQFAAPVTIFQQEHSRLFNLFQVCCSLAQTLQAWLIKGKDLGGPFGVA